MSSGVLSEDELLCPVCVDVFTQPVLLLCGHSFCQACVERFWSSRGHQECPVCSKRFTGLRPPANLALRSVCESFLLSQSSADALCDAHGEKLRLFCLDDQIPVCLVCRDSQKHGGHSFRPLDEAAALLKEELKIELKNLQEKLERFNEIRESFHDTAQHIKTQTQQTRRCVQEEFEQLHQFLRDEERIRISALMEEESEKSQRMNQRIEEMDREIETLTNNIRTIETDIEAPDMPLQFPVFLTGEGGFRVQTPPPDPQISAGALLNVAGHLGNLKFRVWEKMQEILHFTPVTLDPNTAHALLSVSDDLTQVKSSTEGHPYPETPERFDYYQCVLGSRGFGSGSHRWDVELHSNTCWSVGVTTASNCRKGDVFFNTGTWRVRYMAGQYTSQCPFSPRTHLSVRERLKVIRVELDWDAGKVSFSDPLTNTHLRTFTCTFTEAVFPFLYSSCTDFPLRVSPVTISITVEQESV